MASLDYSIQKLPRVKPAQIKALNKLGIFTVRDLLFHFPFRYDDYSKISPISEISAGQVFTVQGKIIDFKSQRTWKKKMIVTEVLIQDDSGLARAIWFGQKFIAQTLRIGKEIRLSGKVSHDSSGLFFSNPAWEFSDRRPTHTGRLVPVYPETEGLTSKWLRWQIQAVFQKGFQIADPVPKRILKKFSLPEIGKALKFIHFPKSEAEYQVARKRFAFEEMFLLQIKSIQTRSVLAREKAIQINFDEKLIKNFISSLPFQLTGAQKKSSFQILKDLEKPRPMNRLLNGDVGSGKTIVAAIAALQTSTAGFQTAIMAPTEVLARQHFESFREIFKNYNLNIGLLTNSYKLTCHPEFISGSHKKSREILERVQNDKKKNTDIAKTIRPKLLKEIRNGNIDILIGTHAVIQEDIAFKNLALAIVDEQHRFGVMQRAYLQQESAKINDGFTNKTPHLLTMTATPIPRTLTMAFFGNLDVSLLDEMPNNRKKVITQVITPPERNKTYEFIRQEIKKERQVFVILPLVEESKALVNIKAAISEHERLSREIFPDLKLGLLHGRLKSREKEKVMRDFKNKKYNILVSTSVVEVGIDVPNATIMMVEDAERFGLSQLHQFRGRVGREKFQSYCFLFTGQSASRNNQRLKTMEKYSDGFKIAEKDLKLRGPGQFLGTSQSGVPDIAMENIANVKLIQISRREAQELLNVDFSLQKHPLLQKSLEKFKEKIHLE